MHMGTHEVHGDIRRETPTAVASTTLAVADISSWLGKAYHAVAEAVASQGTFPAGPPFARHHMLGEGRFEIEAGFPVGTPIEQQGDVRPSTLPGGPVAVTVHTGPYEEMEPAYGALMSWIEAKGGEPVGDAWEVYHSDPREDSDPATWRTEIVQPYRPT